MREKGTRQRDRVRRWDRQTGRYIDRENDEEGDRKKEIDRERQTHRGVKRVKYHRRDRVKDSEGTKRQRHRERQGHRD